MTTALQVPGPELCRGASQLKDIVIWYDDWTPDRGGREPEATAVDAAAAAGGLQALPALQRLLVDTEGVSNCFEEVSSTLEVLRRHNPDLCIDISPRWDNLHKRLPLRQWLNSMFQLTES